MKTQIMTSQLELRLPNHRACRSLPRPQATRATFWFQRMRQIVETAADWPTLPVATRLPAAGGTGTNRD